ncbi:MAG: metal-sensing transcriptional repressor [Caldilineaceae bacterium]
MIAVAKANHHITTRREVASLEQQTQTEVLSRLFSLDDHVRAMIEMVQGGRRCSDLIVQARALRHVMRQVSIILLRADLDCCEEQTDDVTALRRELLALIRQMD